MDFYSLVNQIFGVSKCEDTARQGFGVDETLP